MQVQGFVEEEDVEEAGVDDVGGSVDDVEEGLAAVLRHNCDLLPV